VPRHTLHPEQVIDALWPDAAIDDAGPRLHKAAHFARRLLGDSSALVLWGDTVSLFPAAHVVVDVDEFERSAKQAVAALDRDPRGIGSRGPPLLTGGPASCSLRIRARRGWKFPRDRLRQLHQELLRRSSRWGEFALADPADEEASPVHARQLADSGNRGAALVVGHGTVQLLLSRTGMRRKMQCLTSWRPAVRGRTSWPEHTGKSWGSWNEWAATQPLAHVMARARRIATHEHGGIAKSALD
jgi:hypothetical protein